MQTSDAFKNDFVAIIISNSRPDKVLTYRTLRKHGYSGRIVIVIDDLDATKDEYIRRFGEDNVRIFDKKSTAKMTDNGDNFRDLRTTTHARNASFKIACDLGYKYFIQLDDDYTAFRYRFDSMLNYDVKTNKISNLDAIWSLMLSFFISSKIQCLCMSQGGDFIGGSKSGKAGQIMLTRKIMNSFICCVDRSFKFVSRLNEDVNTFLLHGARGSLLFSTNQVDLAQTTTQKNSGGMTDAYLKYGTYVKSFYSVMYSPSSVTVRELASSVRRLHHAIKWKNTVPMIVRETEKKK